MLLLVGILSALLHARATGEGQVVDAAMVDGSALLATVFRSLLAAGEWVETRESNLLDGGAPFYRTYMTGDGGFLAVGALEPAFFSELLEGLGIDPSEVPDQYDRTRWRAMSARFEERFASRSRGEWLERFRGTDACVSPVLTFSESLADEHLMARGTFVEVDGIPRPAPAPRFSRTPAQTPGARVDRAAEDDVAGTDRLLGLLGYNQAEIGMLRRKRAVR